MASSRSNLAEIEDACAQITLEEEEEGGVEIMESDGEDDSEAVDLRWAFVGRFLTDKNIKSLTMKNVMAAVWRPVKGMRVKTIKPNLFLFQFFHDRDIQRVIKGGPWSFENQPLLCKRLQVGDQPAKVPLFTIEFWVQVYDLPCDFMSEKVDKHVGNYIGVFVESDPNNFGGFWKSYMRVRVAMDVRYPLKRKMKLKKAGGEWVWVTFEYERLNTFCFYCGILGHNEEFCPNSYKDDDSPVAKVYGSWLRAPQRCFGTSIGARWLVEGDEGSQHDPVKEGVDDELRENSEPNITTKLVRDGRKSGVMGVNYGKIITKSVTKKGGAVSMICAAGNQEGGEETDCQEGVIVLDSKRRRKEEETHESSLGENMQIGEEDVSKNLQLAGTSVQARPVQ